MQDNVTSSVGEDATIRLQVKGENSNDVNTRAFTDTSISDLHILVYNSSGVLVSHEYDTSSTVTVHTRSGSGYTIYAIANTGNSALFNGTVASTVTKLQTMVTNSISTLDELKIGGGGLIMSGSKSGLTIIPGTNTAITDFKVIRLAAIITLNITGNNGITVTGYSIKNIPAKSYLLSRPTTYEADPIDNEIGNDAVSLVGTDWLSTGTTSVSSLSFLSTSFYMYENRRGGRITVGGGKGTVGEQQEKAKYTPANATYVEIYAKGSGFTSTYQVYLGGDNSQNYNIKRNVNYTYTITLNAAGSVDTRVTKTDDLTSKKANCYMVAPRQSIIIDVNTKGNGSVTNNQGITVTHTASSVAVLWQTASGLISNISNVSNGTVTLTAGSYEGDAVVAAYSGVGGTGTILWSWHIWVTPYTPGISGTLATSGAVHYYNASTVTGYMMDRNLGALNAIATDTNTSSWGMVYQWGRKDPFPNSTSSLSAIEPILYGAVNSVIKKNGSVPISTTISSPNVYNEITGADWNSSPSNTLWGSGSSKTIFDPCPYGWRVPNSGIWSYFVNSSIPRVFGSFSRGYNFKYSALDTSIAWYPAAGFRISNGGGLTAIGQYGYFWSAGTISGAGLSLRFEDGLVDPNNGSNVRADAFPIRCVRE